MSELTIDTTPALPDNWDWLTQIFSVNVAGIEGLIGAVLGLIILSLISFKYDDWGKTLAPTYFILATLGVLINPIAILASAVWFSISIWNNTGWTIKGLTRISTDAVHSIQGGALNVTGFQGATSLRESKINRLLNKQETIDKRDKKYISVADNPKLHSKLDSLSQVVTGNMLLKSQNKSNRDNKSKQQKLMKEALAQQRLNEVKNKPFLALQQRKEQITQQQNNRKNFETIRSKLFNQFQAYDRELIKLRSQYTNLMKNSNYAFTSTQKEVYKNQADELLNYIKKLNNKKRSVNMQITNLNRRFKQ